MTLGGVRIVPLTEEIPPVFGYPLWKTGDFLWRTGDFLWRTGDFLWRTGDRDPALANGLGISEQVLPTMA